MKPLSAISSKILGQPMFKMLEKIQRLERSGRRILHFELGEPDFSTPENIVDAGCRALNDGMTHYTSSSGLFEFRQAVRETTALSRGFTPDLEQILVTPGANSIIYYTIKCLADPGEDVLVPNPGFSTYFSAILACGANPVSIPLITGAHIGVRGFIMYQAAFAAIGKGSKRIQPAVFLKFDFFPDCHGFSSFKTGNARYSWPISITSTVPEVISVSR